MLGHAESLAECPTSQPIPAKACPEMFPSTPLVLGGDPTHAIDPLAGDLSARKDFRSVFKSGGNILIAKADLPIPPSRSVSEDTLPGDLGIPRIHQDFDCPVGVKFTQPVSSQQAAQVGSRVTGTDGNIVNRSI